MYDYHMTSNEVCIILSAEGKLEGFPPGRAIFYEGELIEIIAGTFFICADSWESEHFESLTDEMIEKYQLFYRRIDWIDLFLGLEPQC